MEKEVEKDKLVNSVKSEVDISKSVFWITLINIGIYFPILGPFIFLILKKKMVLYTIGYNARTCRAALIATCILTVLVSACGIGTLIGVTRYVDGIRVEYSQEDTVSSDADVLSHSWSGQESKEHSGDVDTNWVESAIEFTTEEGTSDFSNPADEEDVNLEQK